MQDESWKGLHLIRAQRVARVYVPNQQERARERRAKVRRMYHEGKSVKDMAAALEVTDITVRNDLWRMRLSVKERRNER